MNSRMNLRLGVWRFWQGAAALAFMLLLHDCARTDAEVERGLVDLGDGLLLQRDGTVVDAWSLPGASAPQDYEIGTWQTPELFRWAASARDPRQPAAMRTD